MGDPIYDFVIIGSGFGGSVSAMRLTEKGYSVLVLERGRRYEDQDFPKRNWNIWNYLWIPALRSFGFLQLHLFNGLFVFGSSGVGGGSLVYANVLMEPDDSFFNAPTWKHLGDWKTLLRPHYQTARHMLGVVANPQITPADEALRQIAGEINDPQGFRPTDVGVFFGEPDVEVPDPYFGGEGPSRVGCNFCGGCMVGCRYNAKNTLPKNYLYFAEKNGAEVWPECEVVDIVPLTLNSLSFKRGVKDERSGVKQQYEIHYRSSTSWLHKPVKTVRARNVIVAAGVLGTHNLLLKCRDETKSLPKISHRLGHLVRTNSEAFVGAFNPHSTVDHSKGVAISSIIHADADTQVEPVRFPDGSSLIFWILSAPMIRAGGNFLQRLGKTFWAGLKRPLDFINMKLIPGWTKRGTALMIMQTKDNLMKLNRGRDVYTLFRRGLVPHHDEANRIPVDIDLGHQVAQAYAGKIGGYPVGTVQEGLLNVPSTAHMLGGCLMGRTADEGVIDENFQVHHYPGLYVIDGSTVPANPGVNPSLTITALAEYAMSRMPGKDAS